MNMRYHPNRAKAILEADAKIAATTPTTADRLAALSDEALAAEYDRMARAVNEADAELARLRKKKWWQRKPKPLPPELRGYQGPAFQAYLARKSLGPVRCEVIAREEKEGRPPNLFA